MSGRARLGPDQPSDDSPTESLGSEFRPNGSVRSRENDIPVLNYYTSKSRRRWYLQVTVPRGTKQPP
jgi:hypothetical protein